MVGESVNAFISILFDNLMAYVHRRRKWGGDEVQLFMWGILICITP